MVVMVVVVVVVGGVVVARVLVVELTVDEGGHQVLVEGLVRGLLNVDVVLDEGLLQISLVTVA